MQEQRKVNREMRKVKEAEKAKRKAEKRKMKESSVRKKRKRVEKGLNVKQGKSKKRRRESEVPESKEECVKAPSRPVSGVGTVDAKPQGGERQSVQSNTFADRRVTT